MNPSRPMTMINLDAPMQKDAVEVVIPESAPIDTILDSHIIPLSTNIVENGEPVSNK